MGDDRLPSDHMTSWNVQIPGGLLSPTPGVVHLPMGSVPRFTKITHIEGYLRAMVSGTLTVTLRDMKDPQNLLIGSISWTEAGDVTGTIGGGEYVLWGPGTGIKFSLSGIALGYTDCNIVVWGRQAF